MQLLDTMFRRTLGADIDEADDEQVRHAFEQWNEHVRETVPADRLLVFDVKQGWEPLCHFLGFPVPDEPFPRVNERKELRSLMGRRSRMSSIIKWLPPMCVIVLLSLSAIRMNK